MEYLNQLNKEQYKAVTTNSKRVLVASSAGSGKTKVLTTRIKYLLDNGVSPNEIIAFTFTKRAAKEMIYRLNNKFNNIYTFHSYSYKMLLNAKDELGFNKFDSIRIVTEEYELYILNEIINDLNIKYSPKSLMQFITKRKNNLEYKFKTTDEARIYNQVYYKFQEYMMQRGEIDFDDMISLFLNNIDNISFKDSILNQCKYILVDEFQDTNQIQYELLKKLSSKYNNLFCVGDINQLIYSFRSSDVRIINEFKDSADEIIYLNQNYRCASNILEKANNLIKHNHNLQSDIYSNINPKFKVIYHELPDTSYQAWEVASTIKRFIEKGNYKPNEIAVLFRNNYQSTEIEYELKRNNIPFIAYGKLKFFKIASTRRMIALYQFLDNPSDYILLLQALQIDDIFYDLIIKRIKSTNKSPLDIIIEMNISDISTKAQAIKELLTIISKYDRKQLFESLLEILFNNPTDKELEYLRALKDIMINSQLKTNKEILDNILLSDDEDINEMGVNLITIHRAKGLEFKCVFIISVNDKIIPQSLKNEDDIKEERRLLYVAMTRAKEYLYLSSAEYHIIHGMRKRLNPSIFVNELN
ncbi:ATP-dependent helicase [Anaeroplasma bactoclasticum]|jgi:DNA helicase-2/ATP-dependent DNA helicase PcrA|nr:ATP-dependent helicase [Anaeroplasma bactoclasticum]